MVTDITGKVRFVADISKLLKENSSVYKESGKN